MRRVITGLDANGRSRVVYDGPPQSIHHVTKVQVGDLEMSHVPDFLDFVPANETCVADIWETDGLPTPAAADPMASPRTFTIEPPGKGLRVRYHVWGANLDSSAMHKTDTLDVNFIIKGEVELRLEEERSVTLRTGDVVVLPGVEHGWRAGPEGVTMLNIMQKMA